MWDITDTYIEDRYRSTSSYIHYVPSSSTQYSVEQDGNLVVAVYRSRLAVIDDDNIVSGNTFHFAADIGPCVTSQSGDAKRWCFVDGYDFRLARFLLTLFRVHAEHNLHSVSTGGKNKLPFYLQNLSKYLLSIQIVTDRAHLSLPCCYDRIELNDSRPKFDFRAQTLKRAGLQEVPPQFIKLGKAVTLSLVSITRRGFTV